MYNKIYQKIRPPDFLVESILSYNMIFKEYVNHETIYKI